MRPSASRSQRRQHLALAVRSSPAVGSSSSSIGVSVTGRRKALASATRCRCPADRPPPCSPQPALRTVRQVGDEVALPPLSAPRAPARRRPRRVTDADVVGDRCRRKGADAAAPRSAGRRQASHRSHADRPTDRAPSRSSDRRTATAPTAPWTCHSHSARRGRSARRGVRPGPAPPGAATARSARRTVSPRTIRSARRRSGTGRPPASWAGVGRLQDGEDPLGRRHPFHAGVELRADRPQRQVGLGREQQHQQRGLPGRRDRAAVAVRSSPRPTRPRGWRAARAPAPTGTPAAAAPSSRAGAARWPGAARRPAPGHDRTVAASGRPWTTSSTWAASTGSTAIAARSVATSPMPTNAMNSGMSGSVTATTTGGGASRPRPAGSRPRPAPGRPAPAAAGSARNSRPAPRCPDRPGWRARRCVSVASHSGPSATARRTSLRAQLRHHPRSGQVGEDLLRVRDDRAQQPRPRRRNAPSRRTACSAGPLLHRGRSLARAGSPGR